MRAGGEGWEDYPDGAYTFPEYDGDRRVVGLSLRANDGRKGAPSSKEGAHRGLIVPDGLDDLPGPTLAVEGPSDVAARLSLGLPAVGRPSNTSGKADLVCLLANDDILVVGERDEKPDGRWPGREGAVTLAEYLANHWDCKIRWTLPPKKTKDIREWVKSSAIGGGGAGEEVTVVHIQVHPRRTDQCRSAVRLSSQILVTELSGERVNVTAAPAEYLALPVTALGHVPQLRFDGLNDELSYGLILGSKNPRLAGDDFSINGRWSITAPHRPHAFRHQVSHRLGHRTCAFIKIWVIGRSEFMSIQ